MTDTQTTFARATLEYDEANACWVPESKEAERLAEPDGNANQTTPADTPNINHEPRVRRTRAATP